MWPHVDKANSRSRVGDSTQTNSIGILQSPSVDYGIVEYWSTLERDGIESGQVNGGLGDGDARLSGGGAQFCIGGFSPSCCWS
ncbi:hypothetical protein Dimus_037746 [Dionaea muscipula]